MSRETGGACMGRRQLADRDIEITEAGLPGSDTRTGSGWLRLGGESWLRMHHDHAPHGLVENAAWHNHPPGSRGEPSRADLKAWQTNLETARKHYGYQVDEFAGIIITPNNRRGTDPTIHAWIISDHGDHYATAEPTLVKIGDPAAHYAPSSGRQRFTLKPTYGGVCTSQRISDNTYQRSNGTQIIQQPMVVATRSFTTTYDGQAIRIIAGRTHVTEDHELARGYPQAWSTRENPIPSHR